MKPASLFFTIQHFTCDKVKFWPGFNQFTKKRVETSDVNALTMSIGSSVNLPNFLSVILFCRSIWQFPFHSELFSSDEVYVFSWIWRLVSGQSFGELQHLFTKCTSPSPRLARKWAMEQNYFLWPLCHTIKVKEEKPILKHTSWMFPRKLSAFTSAEDAA